MVQLSGDNVIRQSTGQQSFCRKDDAMMSVRLNELLYQAHTLTSLSRTG
jgi:hypothetical protein